MSFPVTELVTFSYRGSIFTQSELELKLKDTPYSVKQECN